MASEESPAYYYYYQRTMLQKKSATRWACRGLNPSRQKREGAITHIVGKFQKIRKTQGHHRRLDLTFERHLPPMTPGPMRSA